MFVCRLIVLIIVFFDSSFAMAVPSTERILATSSEGSVTSGQLRALLDRTLDSDYSTTNADYMSTHGLEQALRDLLLERRVAAIATQSGLLSSATVVMKINAVQRDLLLTFAQKSIYDSIQVSDAEIKKSYESRSLDWQLPEEVRLDLYMLPRDDDQSTNPQRQMTELRKILTESPTSTALGGFADVTSGTVVAKAGDFPPPVQELIFGTQTGAVTEVFQRPNAWYVARVLSHETTRTQPLSEIADQLREKLHRQRVMEELEKKTKHLDEAMPLIIVPASVAKVTRQRVHGSAALNTVVGTIAGTSITLADIGGESATNLTGEQLENRIKSVANRLKVVKWAESQDYVNDPEFRTKFEQQRNNLLAREVLSQVSIGTSPSAAALTSYFQKHQENFVVPEQRTVTEVFLPLPREDAVTSNAATFNQALFKRRKVMQQIRYALSTGSTITRALETVSELKDDIRVIDQGTHPEGPRGRVLDMAVRNLKPGEVSSVQETRQGLRLFIVQDVLSARARSFEEARTDVQRVWTQEAMQKARQALIDRVASTITVNIDHEALQDFRTSYLN